MASIPKSKPQISREEVLLLLEINGIDLQKEKAILIGMRGYYRDTFGAKGKNDVGVWDDAFVWLDKDGAFATFNGNTDPSRYFSRVATLKVGKWRYKKGNHGSAAYGPYPAFRQAANVTVLRFDGRSPAIADTGQFGINIHHGSKGAGNGTSSLGCQTIPHAQWAAFKSYGDMLIGKHGLKDFLYFLIDVSVGLGLPTKKDPQPAKDVLRSVKDLAVNQIGVDLVKHFEGKKLTAYIDPVGVPTIGYGRIKGVTKADVVAKKTITEAQAEDFLKEDLEAEGSKYVRAWVKVPLNENQFAALSSFTYNRGAGRFKEKLLGLVNAGRHEEAIQCILTYNWAMSGGSRTILAGLTRRRKAEAALYAGDVESCKFFMRG